ncbi:MAG: hypothetical protein QM504_17175 [Pseudomonadota bacterium]
MMLSEVIDKIIIGAVLLFALLFIINRIKKALTNNDQTMCHGCTDKACNPKEKKNCHLPLS